MSQIQALINKSLEETKLRKQEDESLKTKLMETYEQLRNNLSFIKEQTTDLQETRNKLINELIRNKIVLSRIMNNNVKSNTGLTLSVTNQELFATFMSNATDAVNKAPSRAFSLQHSNNMNFDMIKNVNLLPENIKKVIDEVKKSTELIESLHTNMNIISLNSEEFNFSDDEKNSDISIFNY